MRTAHTSTSSSLAPNRSALLSPNHRTGRPLRRALLGAFCFGLACVALPSSGFSQELEDQGVRAEAARLYNIARKALDDEQFHMAATNFEAASRIRPHAVAMYTAAQAWELAEEPARAADAFAQALKIPGLDETQTARAKERLKALEQNLGIIEVFGEETTRVQLNDHSEFLAPARLHASEGSHSLLILRVDGSIDRVKIDISAGETLELDTEQTKPEEPKENASPVPLAEPKRRPLDSAEQESTSSSGLWSTAGYISLGAGLGSLVGGALLGLSASDAESTYEASPSEETLSHAQGLATKTNIMLITGGVLTAAGLGIIIFQPGKKSGKGANSEAAHTEASLKQSGITIRLGPTQLWAEGRF